MNQQVFPNDTTPTYYVSQALTWGTYTPVWVNVAGFTGTPTVTGSFTKVGNIVTVSFTSGPVNTIGGSNTATITLPLPPHNNFVGTEISGTVTALLAYLESGVSATPGAKTATISLPAGADTGQVQGIFTYVLS